MFRGIFVTGTDTNVGKTVVSAALMLRYGGEAPLRYWKPVQTGVELADDSQEVVRLAGCSPADVLAEGVRLERPLSPHLAARLAGRRITVRSLVEHLASQPAGTRWIVEGAGGVMVPLNERETIADLIHALQIPVLVAARSVLGTINHSLLTIEALRRRKLRVAGVVLVGGSPEDEHWMAIERYGAAEVVAQMPTFDPLTPDALSRWATAEFDQGGALFVGCLR